MKCKACDGLGTVECDDCKGEGISSGIQKCISCSGDGMINCAACSGKGKVGFFNKMKTGN